MQASQARTVAMKKRMVDLNKVLQMIIKAANEGKFEVVVSKETDFYTLNYLIKEYNYRIINVNDKIIINWE